MVGDGGAEAPGLEPSPSHPGECRLCSLHLARSRASGGWWDPGPRLLEKARTSCSKCRNTPRVTLDPSMGGGERQQQWWEEGRSGRGAHTRDTGCRSNTAPEQAALPFPSLCLPPCRLGSGWPREPRKSKRQQLLNHGSPFIAQPSRAWPPPPAGGAETQAPAPGLSPTQPAGARGRGDGALGAGGSPTTSPPLPTQALQQGPGQG